EAVVNTVQPTAANPRSSSFTDSLNGSIDLSNEWTLNLGGSLTMQGRTPASQRGQFPESASVVTVLSAGADWNVNENLAVGTELQVTPVPLDSERFSANVSATLFTDTDVTLSGDYYVYQQNPAQVGFFTLVAAGRGAGVPIAPLRYEVRPEVVHRFGDLSARL